MNFDALLKFLDGKKAKILAVAGIIIGYLATTNNIDPKLGEMILAILSILAGGASYATDKVFGRAIRGK